MHLNECLELVFPSSSTDATNNANIETTTTTNNEQLKLLDDDYPQGSILSVLQCIGSDWAFKSKTNFYIPPEYYAGYSYLYSENEESFSHVAATTTAMNHHHHHHHHQIPFVNADSPSNLHTHHYQPHPLMSYTMYSTPKETLMNNATHHESMMTDADSHAIDNNVPTIHHQTLQINNNNNNNIKQHSHHYTTTTIATPHPLPHPNTMLMTIPYHHPHLELPVPPLDLPWYFALLCWSFTLGGIVMLCLTPKWIKCGGGNNNGYCRRHWFPYRTFAWLLILFQGPSSFLADYVHMTNISIWHILDRFLASTLMALELVKIITMRPYTRPIIYILYLASASAAILCFMKSQECQGTLDADGFVFWHCGWHCQPIVSSVVFLLDWWMTSQYGDYYAFPPLLLKTSSNRNEEEEKEIVQPHEREQIVYENANDNDNVVGVGDCKYKKGEMGGVLLSSIAMEYAEHDGNDLYKAGSNSRSSIINATDAVLTSPLRRSRRIAGKAPEIR